MRETGIDLLHDEDKITLTTTCRNERKQVLERLEARDAKYRKTDWTINGEWDSTRFTISRNDARMPRKIVKSPDPNS